MSDEAWRGLRAHEPVLATDSIQAHVLVGLRTGYQVFVFLRIERAGSFRTWLRSQVGHVTSAEAFLRALQSPTRPETVFMNLALTHQALALLDPEGEGFGESAFREGQAARSSELGDPTASDVPGSPSNWLVRDGSENTERVAHVLFILAGWNAPAVDRRARRLVRDAQGASPAGFERSVFPGRQVGRAISVPWGGSSKGKEHFGYKDGIAQPVLRGRWAFDQDKFLAPSSSSRVDFADDGMPLMWPGSFVLGYPRQPSDPAANRFEFSSPGPVSEEGPEFAKHGSFMVFRRLRQDVAGFHDFLRESAESAGVDPELVGASCVGRWADGRPLLDAEESKANAFDYADDPAGALCPLTAHVRRANPRGDRSSVAGPGRRGGGTTRNAAGSPVTLNRVDTLSHSIIRRGIPYGPASLSTPRHPLRDPVDRGLLFVAYMASIEDQFEYITRNWINNPDFRDPDPGTPLADGILGTAHGRNDARVVVATGTETMEVSAKSFVTPTGGAYLFAPSIEGLRVLCAV